MIAEALAAGTLVPFLEGYEWFEVSPGPNVYAVFPPTRHPSRRVRVFTDFLAERLHD